MQIAAILPRSYMIGKATLLFSSGRHWLACIKSLLGYWPVVLVAFFISSQAHADVCDDLASQLRNSGRAISSGGGAEVAQLSRQLAALRGLQRQRQCSSKGDGGGFFNACGDIAKRIAGVQSQIAQAGRPRGGGNIKAIRARMSAVGCLKNTVRTAKAEAPRAERREERPTRAAPSYASSPTVMFCVRLSDGYYFPAPNSQFVSESQYDSTLDRCRYICADMNMDVYSLDDVALETEEMQSVKTRRFYRDLPVAFAYREAADFRSCDLQRYYRRVNEARARTVTPKNLKNAIIPLPAARPDRLETATIEKPQERIAAPAMAYTEQKPVRIVGPTFLPNE